MTESSMLDFEEAGLDSMSIPLDSFEEKTAKKHKAAAPPPPAAGELMVRHAVNFNNLTGRTYQPSLARDTRQAKMLVKTYGLERALALNDAFFATMKDDALAKASDYDFAVFKAVTPGLVLRTMRDENLRPGDLE